MTDGEALTILLTAVVSMNGTAAVRAYARKRLMDTPNERSSHTVPTPRGGGLAIVGAFFFGLLIVWIGGNVGTRFTLALLGGGLIVAFIGFLDDRNHVSARLRFAVHAAAALWGLAWLGGIPPLPVAGWLWTPGAVGFVIGLVGLIWLINLTNFMDGIDGITGSQAVFVSLAGGVMFALAGAPGMAAICLILAAAVAGFLVFNWPPASLFMGDVGSGFLGLTLGLIAIAGAADVNLWVWGILLAPFIADATVTRAVRVLRYRDWFAAHRTHVYQRRSRAWGGHLPVVRALWALDLVFVLPLAVIAFVMPGLGWLAMLIVWAVLFIGAWREGAGRDDGDTGGDAN